MDTTMPEGTEDQTALFDVDAEVLAPTLADRFIVPPFSVLDRRQGTWQDRKRRWLSLGIESELGRDGALTYDVGTSWLADQVEAAGGATSVFDPVLCELAYRWFSRPGDRVLDPFAGGSVRGIVASALARWYTGIELRPEQVAANQAQAHLGSDITPQWIEGDATTIGLGWLEGDFDMTFTCPPYAYLERYSEDPADLSTMDYPAFCAAMALVWEAQYALLRPDRFAVWVISDVRQGKGDGQYEGVVADTIKAAQAAGFRLYNDLVIIDPVGTLAVRSGRQFDLTRKVGRGHQHMLVFAKGDGKAAGKRVAADE